MFKWDRVNCQAVSLPGPKPKKSGDFRLASGLENTKRFRRRNHHLPLEAPFPRASWNDVAEKTRIEQTQREFVTSQLTKTLFEQRLEGHKLRFYQSLEARLNARVSRFGTGLRARKSSPGPRAQLSTTYILQSQRAHRTSRHADSQRADSLKHGIVSARLLFVHRGRW